jgi:hypothetical protein
MTRIKIYLLICIYLAPCVILHFSRIQSNVIAFDFKVLANRLSSLLSTFNHSA